MSKPYKPRNPLSNSAYSKRRRKEESDRLVNELKEKGNWNEEESFNTGCIITIVIVGFICLILFIIGGSDAVFDWLTR